MRVVGPRAPGGAPPRGLPSNTVPVAPMKAPRRTVAHSSFLRLAAPLCLAFAVPNTEECLSRLLLKERIRDTSDIFDAPRPVAWPPFVV